MMQRHAILPTIDDVRAAACRLQGHAVVTPCFPCESLGLWLKAESLQRGGSFKFRGALNRLLCVPEDARSRGVVSYSSGNHAQAVAIAARLLDVPATIVMPEDSMPHKVRATMGHGARVFQKGVTMGNCADVAKTLADASGATVIPPFDDPQVMAGQGTTALEILEVTPDLGTLVVGLGGGGLLGGMALAARALRPGLRIIGVEPAAGNDGQQSLRMGRRVEIDPPSTIADGARTTHVGELPFASMQAHVDDVVTVDDEALLDAMARLALEARLVVEPTGALAVAGLLSGAVRAEGPTCAVIGGGNVAPEILSRALGRA